MLDGPSGGSCPSLSHWRQPMTEVAQELAAALDGLLEQVYQMRGMFRDEDRAIARAVDDAEVALKEYRKAKRR